MNSVWSIFDEPPEDLWGLRGDVYMWNLLRSACWNYETMTVAEFDELASNVYSKATGHGLQGEGEDFVLLFFVVGYGMSKGYVSRKWWIDKGLPILRERLRLYNARNGYVNSNEDASVGAQEDIEAKKAAVKAKLASMTVAEKLPYAIKGIKKKLLLDPTNVELQKKLELYEKKLAELTAETT